MNCGLDISRLNIDNVSSCMVTYNINKGKKIRTEIGDIFIPHSMVTDFIPGEFIDDFTLLINKSINIRLHIHIEYNEIQNQLYINVSGEMIGYDNFSKIEKCANVLLKYRGRYNRPPKLIMGGSLSAS